MEVTATEIILKPKVRAYSPSQIIRKKRVIYSFESEDKKFFESFGNPERIAKWFITGQPSTGKSSLLFNLSNFLTRFGKVDYNNFEEGDSQTVVEKIKMHGLHDKDGRFKLLPKVDLAAFKHRLLKRKSAAFAVIDSIQHAMINKQIYISLVDDLCIPKKGKSILFISHGVKNDLTKFIKHDCDIKVEVIGFVANAQSRYGGGRPFVIWEEGARRYWQKKYNAVIQGRYWPGQKK